MGHRLGITLSWGRRGEKLKDGNDNNFSFWKNCCHFQGVDCKRWGGLGRDEIAAPEAVLFHLVVQQLAGDPDTFGRPGDVPLIAEQGILDGLTLESRLGGDQVSVGGDRPWGGR